MRFLKICKKCNVECDVALFSTNSCICKECKRQYKASRKLESKRFIYNYLLRNPCIDCGESDPIVLEFDHLGDKEVNISAVFRSGWSIKRITKEIEKCQVLCSNCHARKTAKDQNWYSYRMSIGNLDI